MTIKWIIRLTESSPLVFTMYECVISKEFMVFDKEILNQGPLALFI